MMQANHGAHRVGTKSASELKQPPIVYPQFDVRLPVVCFDFDGVLASAKWPKPEIGEPDPAAKEAVEHYASKGCEVIVCSARPASHHPRIWKWLEDQGLSWAIYDVTDRKPVASVYFDDRCHRWPLSNVGGNTELAWAAGFYDGEGCTTLLKKGKSISVRATCAQKDRRALDRFHAAIGGIGAISGPQKSGVSNWVSNSQPAALEVLDMLWPYLGPAKKEQAERCLSQSTWHNGQKDKLECADPTHEIADRSEGVGRRCRTCQREYMKAYYQRRKDKS